MSPCTCSTLLCSLRYPHVYHKFTFLRWVIVPPAHAPSSSVRQDIFHELPTSHIHCINLNLDILILNDFSSPPLCILMHQKLTFLRWVIVPPAHAPPSRVRQDILHELPISHICCINLKKTTTCFEFSIFCMIVSYMSFHL